MRKKNQSLVAQCIDVWKEYRKEYRGNHAALCDINLELFTGEILLVLGKSGAGKTTLLNLIAGLDKPTRGRITVGGKDLEILSEKNRAQWRRENLGFVFQFFNLLPTLTVFENVYLSLEMLKRNEPETVLKVLDKVGLGDKLNRFPHELSGGEQQRVAIARAVVKNPLLILADEPTGNLDTGTGNRVLEILTGYCRKSGTTMIMVSHSPQSTKYADRLIEMADGRIIKNTRRGSDVT